MRNAFYLTGLDWMIHAMCSSARRCAKTGISSQIVLELEGMLDEAVFKETAQRFALAFPILNGKVSRNGLLEPYWAIPRRSKPPDLRVEVYHLAEEEISHTLETCVNKPFRHAREYVVFHLLYPSTKCCLLAMTFDHRLLDAHGAEQFMFLFCQYASGSIELDKIDYTPPVRRPGLFSQWKKAFNGINCIIHTIHKNVIGSNMVRLTGKKSSLQNEGDFIHLCLNERDSKNVLKRANREAGYLMFMPYALSIACSAFGELAVHRNMTGSFFIPCTTDLRSRDVSWKQMFFNYCSLFFFKVDSESTKNRSLLIQSLKEQFFQQTKEGFPHHLAHFFSLMRYIPIRIFGWMNSKNHASFSFASVGKSLFKEQTLFNLKINNVYHFPLIPPHVGIGFFFTSFRGKINMGVSFRKGILSHEEIKMVQEALLKF